MVTSPTTSAGAARRDQPSADEQFQRQEQECGGEGPLEQLDMLGHSLGAQRSLRHLAKGRHEFLPRRAIIPARKRPA